MRLSSLIAAGLLFAGATGAAAMPAAPLSSGGNGLTLVRGGCGWGAHRGIYGGCRLNPGWRGHMRGAMGGAPLGCPPGTHPTGGGYCRRNGH